MRRYTACCLIVAGCCAVHALNSAHALGDDRLRMSAFRALTSEQSEGQNATTSAEQSPVEAGSGATVVPPISTHPPAMTPQTGPAQSTPAPRMNATSPVYAQPGPASQARPSHSFYGGASARATLSQFPRRVAAQPNAPRPTRRQSKPFQNIESEPTLSPYLNLDRDDNDPQNVPNYFTLVRPQIEQLYTNRVQQREIQQLRGQIQSMTSVGAAPQYEASRAAGMGSPARYMDTAQFYGNMR